MRLSNLADYAVVVMSAAARHCGSARISAAELAQETGLPAPTVQKLVSRLVSAGLLRSLRGAKGGLQLARPAAAITLVDIVEAVEGPIALTACVESGTATGGKRDCGMEDSCAVRPHWPMVNAVMRDALAGIPLTRLADLQAPAIEARSHGGSPARMEMTR
ncbi:SUF system Fe-S cluster assembly regulator [Altererythrobacter sp. SALINAS58]|uniref:SUF system Fe-S cluster assembly regulator n=1 Tax=Alteripontixanthobacter muriae TaxID=2705546 RepID=UPI0015764863|nr:SUF system Fe-S cluster assembly regulator [Alteripontixanthobacter muriae]NTZ43571.1 SUF system Fe-S cluster assembly regulator [Alteripontixanthobacter muriae]